jgi:nucleoside-diphosphate-sugar epimerase
MDVYATSKVCMERIAHSFALRFPSVDIYCLRIGAVIAPADHAAKFDAYLSRPGDFKVHAWSYTDARDLGNMVERCLQTDGLGFEVFNAVNDECTLPEGRGTVEWLREVCPETEIVGELGDREAPVCNRKIKEALGFREEFAWRKVREGAMGSE